MCDKWKKKVLMIKWINLGGRYLAEILDIGYYYC
jgi:hypothetical protein